jgi:hypothetical protein
MSSTASSRPSGSQDGFVVCLAPVYSPSSLRTYKEDELQDIRSRWKRFRIGRVPRTVVPTSVFVVGVSRIGRARIGAGQPFEQIRGTKKHTRDGIIAAKADYEGAVLVTGDGRLARRASEADVRVWSFE